MSQRARLAILANGGADCVNDPKTEEPALYARNFRFNEQGELRSLLTYTLSAPYFCGVGPGHHTVDGEVEVDSIPPDLGALARVPNWLARELSKELPPGSSNGRVVGVSPLKPNMDANALLEQFRTAPTARP